MIKLTIKISVKITRMFLDDKYRYDIANWLE